MKKEKSCGLILYDFRDNKRHVLIIKQQTHWGFPKGHMENNETEEETAIREVFEETGILASPFATDKIRLISQYKIYTDTLKEVVYFIGIPSSREITRQTSEIDDAKWVEISEALNTLTYNQDVMHLNMCEEFISSIDAPKIWKKHLR